MILPDGAPALEGAAACAWSLLTRGPLVPAAPVVERELRRRFGARAGAALGAVHRVQAAALAATGGAPLRVETDLAVEGVFTPAEARALCALAREDLDGLLRELAGAGFAPARAAEACFVSFGAEGASGLTRAWTCAGWSADAQEESLAAWALPTFPPEERALAALAERLLGIVPERTSLEACARLVSGADALIETEAWHVARAPVVLAALLRPGRPVVLGPTAAGRRAWGRAFASAGARAPRLLAPESLDFSATRGRLRALVEDEGASLLVVDEAAAVVERGRGFRPAMARAGTRLREWTRAPSAGPPLAALCPGASAAVSDAATRRLGIATSARLRAEAGVPEPAFRILSAERGAVDALTGLFSGEKRFGPGLVLCAGAAEAEALAAELAWSRGLDAGTRLGRRWDILCLPSARAADAGGGPWRIVAHLGPSESREELLARLGAAGPAEERVLLLPVEGERPRREPPGLETEFADALLVLSLIGDPAEPGETVVALPGQDSFALARALWRLEAAGAARLEERRGDGWLVRRPGGTTREATLGAVRAALERRYRESRSRRTAAEETKAAASSRALRTAFTASSKEASVLRAVFSRPS